MGIKDRFKQVFISGEHKKKKSTGELFAYAIEESEHPAHEIVLVGDSYKRDVIGGLKAGLKVIWFNHRNEKNEGQPVPEIRSLSELEDKLKKSRPF